MIVVAVIGILAIVLLPKIGTIKTTAKSAGIDTNMRMVQAVVQSKISDYAGKAGTVINSVSAENTLANELVNTLNNGDKIVDPFNSGASGAGVLADNTKIPGTTQAVVLAVVPSTTEPTLTTTASTTLQGNPQVAANANGVLYVAVYDNPNNKDVIVKITPYDENGTPLTNKAVTINP